MQSTRHRQAIGWSRPWHWGIAAPEPLITASRRCSKSSGRNGWSQPTINTRGRFAFWAKWNALSSALIGPIPATRSASNGSFKSHNWSASRTAMATQSECVCANSAIIEISGLPPRRRLGFEPPMRDPSPPAAITIAGRNWAGGLDVFIGAPVLSARPWRRRITDHGNSRNMLRQPDFTRTNLQKTNGSVKAGYAGVICRSVNRAHICGHQAGRAERFHRILDKAFPSP